MRATDPGCPIASRSVLVGVPSGDTKEGGLAGSAAIDFILLDLILCRDVPPADAVRQVQKSMTFAGETAAPDRLIKATGLEILE
jgi:hypothetical protein